MAGVRNHEELETWQLAGELAQQMRPIVDRPAFRRHEKLRSQIEEASESPPSHIAEGFARYVPRDNARFVRMAAGSLNELLVHLTRARARRLITAEEHAELSRLTRRALGAASSYAAYLETAEPPPRRLRPPRRERKNQEPSTSNQEPSNPEPRTGNLEP